MADQESDAQDPGEQTQAWTHTLVTFFRTINLPNLAGLIRVNPITVDPTPLIQMIADHMGQGENPALVGFGQLLQALENGVAAGQLDLQNLHVQIHHRDGVLAHITAMNAAAAAAPAERAFAVFQHRHLITDPVCFTGEGKDFVRLQKKYVT